jgi:LysM repeat protein
VCYGAFKALNAPDPDLPPELAEWVSEEPDFDSLVDDIQVPQSGNSKFETELEGLPTISLPQAEPPSLTKPESNLHANTLGGPISIPVSTLQGTDGPAIEVPAPLDVAKPDAASDSLVPDNFSSAPLEKPAVIAPSPITSTQLPNSANSVASDFPSIPLPKGNLLVTQKLDVGARPLLEDNLTPESNSTGQTTSPTNSPAQVVLEPFATAREQALKEANEGKLKDALVSLTRYYHSPELPRKEYEDLLDILDALAREVIYSPRHLLKPAFTTGASDTLVSIAAQHNVTPELLKSINQLGDTQVLTQGQQLKVIEGPFRGEVDLTVGEMTLYLNDMYACRFPIAVGTDYDSKVGKFEVAEKRTDRSYYGANRQVIKADDPSNPYGGYWIGLGGNCIHGSPEMAATDLKNAGCISLAPIDAADTFIMLTLGSQVEFRK